MHGLELVRTGEIVSIYGNKYEALLCQCKRCREFDVKVVKVDDGIYLPFRDAMDYLKFKDFVEMLDEMDLGDKID